MFKIRFNHNSTAISIVMLNLGSLEKQHNISRFSTSFVILNRNCFVVYVITATAILQCGQEK